MKLYLLRHGDAGERGDPKFSNDAERPLSFKGRERTKLLAHALRSWEISFDVIWSSPLVRARQTAEIVAHGLRLHRRLEFTGHLAPGADAEKLVALVNGFRPAPRSALLVGHEPFLSGFISLLCTGGPQLSLTLKKGALCRLEVERLDCTRCASLDWLLPPRLQAAGRPPRREKK
jgi:phosphohistidine phosphatase